MSKEAMKLVLEALEAADWYINQLEITLYSADDAGTHEDRLKVQQAITVMRLEIDALNMASKLALAEQPAQQEPVAIHQFRSPHCSDWYDGVPDHHDGHGPYEVRTLYASPPAQRTWVGLTEEEINIAASVQSWKPFARVIEAKLKEKNQ